MTEAEFMRQVLKGFLLIGILMLGWWLAGPRIRAAILKHKELFVCRVPECGFVSPLVGYMAIHNSGHMAQALTEMAKAGKKLR